jgi:hypothetical protein
MHGKAFFYFYDSNIDAGLRVTRVRPSAPPPAGCGGGQDNGPYDKSDGTFGTDCNKEIAIFLCEHNSKHA